MVKYAGKIAQTKYTQHSTNWLLSYTNSNGLLSKLHCISHIAQQQIYVNKTDYGHYTSISV